MRTNNVIAGGYGGGNGVQTTSMVGGGGGGGGGGAKTTKIEVILKVAGAKPASKLELYWAEQAPRQTRLATWPPAGIGYWEER
jgi:hypothetical protein